MFMGELRQELCALAQLGLEDHRQPPVRREAREVQFGKALELGARIGDLLQLFVRNPQEQREGMLERRHEDLLFALEVEVDRAVGDVGLARDIGDAGVEIAVLSEYVNGCLQDPVSLF